MNENDYSKPEDKIDQLNQGLYSPNAPEVNKIFKRGINDGQDTQNSNELHRDWKPIEKPKGFSRFFGWTNHEQPIFKKILWFALGFFILSLAVGTYIYINGLNSISASKIDVNVSAPLSVSASNPFVMDISLTNRNNSEISNVDVLVDYPDGTREVEDNTKPFVNDLIDVGTITKGQVVKKRSEAIFFGQEGEKKNIDITLHYMVPGSSSIFEKTISYVVTISSAPVTVRVDSVKELNSNQEISFDIKVTSNSSALLKNVAVQPTFPFGFSLSGATPAFNNTSSFNPASMWIIDELAPAESKDFKIVGLLKGEKAEDKDFKFIVGSIDPNNSQLISTQYVTVDKLVTIQLPFISTNIAFNGNTGNSADVISSGQVAIGSINFANNLQTDITDLELVLKLNDNNLIDKNRIQTTDGFYSSLTNTITWDKKTRDDFVALHPGQIGNVTFSLPFIDPSITALRTGNLKNLIANFDLTIHGKRLSDANVPEYITLLDSKSVKVGTDVTINPAITYTTGPFSNTGPLPPRVNIPTSYTVTLELSNTLNDIKEGVVTTVLPPYINFEGSISPSTENLTFNKGTNEVTWNVGTLFTGQGFKSAEKKISFKIILTPSANQINTVPQLISDINFQGVDTFTGQVVKTAHVGLSTDLTNDPGFSRGQGRIGQ